MNVPTLPPPAMTTRISGPSVSPVRPRCASNASTASPATADVDDVAVLGDQVGVGDLRRRRAG